MEFIFVGNLNELVIRDTQDAADTTLIQAVVDMAARHTLAVDRDRSAILSGLAPLQWLLQQSRGHALSFYQALELDEALKCFCDDGHPIDAMLETAIGFLQATDDRVAQVIADWQIIDQAGSRDHQARHALPKFYPFGTVLAA